MRRQGGLWCPPVLLVMLLLWAGAAWAEVCKGSKVPKAELRRYDAKATLSHREIETAFATHLPYGQPACPRLLTGREYVRCYTMNQRAALWAASGLRDQDAVTRARHDAFRSDPRLTADENAHCSDSKASRSRPSPVAGWESQHATTKSWSARTPAVRPSPSRSFSPTKRSGSRCSRGGRMTTDPRCGRPTVSRKPAWSASARSNSSRTWTSCGAWIGRR